VALTQQQYDAMLVGDDRTPQPNHAKPVVQLNPTADLDRAAGGRITGPASATPRPAAWLRR
jgi:hypothetical protein